MRARWRDRLPWRKRHPQAGSDGRLGDVAAGLARQVSDLLVAAASVAPAIGEEPAFNAFGDRVTTIIEGDSNGALQRAIGAATAGSRVTRAGGP